ncbi:MAG TPA: tetratricopeptide repeat protein [Candidatus Polarisedimenticolaceae bacterium]|nr:tetratricopeptide repeat protein [Candidatus Polarisedimenticolaceae bacterium]
MDRPRLTVVTDADAAGVGTRAPVPLVGLLVILAAAAASGLGADRARVKPEPREIARRALATAMEHGSDAAAVRDDLTRLREDLARRPLDSATRVAYASLVLGLARGPDDLAVADFHARLATRISPVTVPVVRAAATVLARSGGPEETVRLIHEMFQYDAAAAARLLGQLGFLLTEEQSAAAVADRPEAWLAWARRLREIGRGEEADRWVVRGNARWPDDLGLLVPAVEQAARAGDWARVARLLPADRTIPLVPDAAILYAYRSRARNRAGQTAAAVEDAATAVRVGRDYATVLAYAGDAYAELGDAVEARTVWSRALFLTPPDATDYRLRILLSLARLEERDGRPATALRHWRSVLVVDPDNDEARRRIAALTGARP